MIVDILTISFNYFRTGDFQVLQNKMEFYEIHLLKLNSEGFLTPILENERSVDQAKKILKRLNIPKSQWGKYLACGSAYEFLEKLSKNGIAQADDLLNAIDEKRATGKLQLIFGILFLALFIALLLLSPPMAGVLASLKAFLGSATSISVISLLYTGVVALYSSYQNQFDHRKTMMSRIIDNFFLLSTGALNGAGYILLIGTSAVMSPLIGALFVAAAGVDVVKAAVALVREYVSYDSISSSPKNNPLAHQQAVIRHDLNYKKHRNELIINMTSAALLVGLMAVWNFVPGGFFVTAAVLVGIGVVYAAKALVNKYNERDIREKLQKELNELEEKAEPSELAELNEVNPFRRLNTTRRIEQGFVVKDSYVPFAVQASNVEPNPPAQQPKPSDLNRRRPSFFTMDDASNTSNKKLNETAAPPVPGGK